MATTWSRGRLWLVYLVVGAVVTAAGMALRGMAHDAVYDLTGLSAVGAILLGLRLHRPGRPGAWYCLAGGLAVFVVGDVVYSVYADVLQRSPFPSPADVLYLASYPLLAASMLVMIRSRTRGRDRVGLIDASIVATGLGLLSWTFLMKPITSDSTMTVAAKLISLAYPVADVLLLAVLARLVASPGARTSAYRLLAGALLLQLGADVAFAVLTSVSSYTGGLVDVGWMLSYLFWGAAALHPSMRSLAEVAPDRGVRVTRRRILLLAPVSLIAPSLLLLQGVRGWQVDWSALGIGSMVLFLLVVVRMSGLVTQVQDQAAQLTALAHNDALTGIPNRRAWDMDLVREMARARRTASTLHVALLDVDNFKRFNDANGHQAGDLLLKNATASWKAQLREGDTLARYGGEEFTAMLIGCSLEEAAAILDRVREATPLGETVSIGVVQWDGQEGPEHLIGRADTALYHAKHQGRNQVVAARSPIRPPTGREAAAV